MELAVLLLLFACFIFGFKLLAILLKTGLFVLTIPFQIFGAILGVFLTILIVPLAAITGVFAIIFAPFLILGPLLPFLLVLGGLYLVAKNA